jgi:hypothetical protein
MTTQIILKAKKVQRNDGGFPFTVVKRGRNIEAKIFNPNKYTNGEFQISMNTLAFYRPTLKDALEFVRKSVEGRMNAFGGAFGSVEVTLEENF